MRRSVTDLGATGLETYKRAIRAMLSLPPTDPRNWYRQAIIHLLDCPHGNWWFLPWHRGYLFHFEEICRQLSADDSFALPFWDWTAAPRVPAVLFDDVLTPTHELYEESFEKFRPKFETAIGDLWNGLTARQREQLSLRGIASLGDIWERLEKFFSARDEARAPTRDKPDLPDWATREVGAERVNAALAPTRYEDFGSTPAANHHVRAILDTLESAPHNNVHNAVGGGPGFMSELLAPVDPIFWLHHANIDRLWDIWAARERRAGRTAMPEDVATWSNEPFLFFADASTPGGEASSGRYLHSSELGYRYGEGFGDELLKESQETNPRELQPQRLGAAMFEGEKVRLPLRTDVEASAAVRVPNNVLVAARTPKGARSPAAPGIQASSDSKAPREPGQLVARVTLIPPPNARSVRVLFFLNCPYLTPQTPLTDPHYVGSVTFFGTHAGVHHEGALTHTATLPLNGTLQRLATAGRPVKNQVRLQAIAADDGGGERILNGALTQVSIKSV